MIVLMLLACSAYDRGYQDGCDFGHHYGREHGLQIGTACVEADWIEAPWPAYLLDDETYEAGRDDGYDACYVVARDCAIAEVAPTWHPAGCEFTPDVDPYSDDCAATWPSQ